MSRRDGTVKCSVEGCELPSRSKGMCHRHYRRWHKYGDAGPAGKLRTDSKGVCSVEGCDVEAMTKGLCRNHYRRYLKWGDPGPADSQREPWVVAKCSVEGCENDARVHGVCDKHYARLRKHGDAAHPVEEPKGSIHSQGYRMISVNGITQVPEHRLVMEEVLGRRLTDDETVHHKNGDRLDNRPENLELWTSRHGKGQRVEDQVAWAVEILKLYAPDLLK